MQCSIMPFVLMQTILVTNVSWIKQPPASHGILGFIRKRGYIQASYKYKPISCLLLNIILFLNMKFTLIALFVFASITIASATRPGAKQEDPSDDEICIQVIIPW